VSVTARLLNDDEEVFVDLHPHWMRFTVPVLALVAAIGIGVVSLRFEPDSLLRTVFGWLAIGVIALTALWTLIRALTWSTVHFVVTDQRIIYRSGWLTKTGIDIPLDRVNNVVIRQRILHRLFGAGDLVVESAGESGQQRFGHITSPGRVQNIVFERIRAHQATTGGANGSDVAEQLERLEGMLRRGTLTRGEFEVHKRRLLG
jgi:uncharacterized membrane protein YdbT with pleckstrin-like domain